MTARRHVLIGGVAAVAAAAGGTLAWRRHVASEADTGMQALWDLRLARPEGGELALASFRGKPLLLNFWATWCEPCLREMPALNQFQREVQPRGWQVLGLAVDGPTPVREFLAKRPVGFPIGLAGLDGTDLMVGLGNRQGGLPFSVLVDAGGRIVQRKLGETKLEELQGWARGA